jgi:hypothetical protein
MLPLTKTQIAATILAAAVTVGPTAVCVAHADLGDIMFRIVSGAGPSMFIEASEAGAQLKMRVVGKFSFNDAESDIETLTGRATIIEKKDGVTRRLDLKSDGSKGINRSYTVNGKTVSFDADAKAWLAKVIPSLMRETSVNVDARVGRILAAGGMTAVFDEIDKIQSGHARSKYIEAVMKKGPVDDKLTPRLFAAVRAVDSDFARKNVLLAIIGKQTLTNTQQVNILNAVDEMDSDFEQRVVLCALAPLLTAEPTVLQAWRSTISRMDSDFEIRQVIDALAKRPTLSAAQIDAAIEATNTLDSDFERATALKSLIRHLEKGTPQQIDAFLKSARAIDSSFELKGVVTALVKRVPLEKTAFAAVFVSIDAIDSDFEKRAALEAVAKKLPRDADLVARYRKSARSLGEFERAQAEKALANQSL